MNISSHERALLPLIALQGAVGTLAGFIGFFIMRAHDVNALFGFTAGMLTTAIAATFLAYLFGPRLKLTGKRLLKLGFLVPGLLILCGDGSIAVMALAYGSFVGLSWSARHWLEMSLLADAERDGYAAHSGALTVVFGIVTTLVATLLLAGTAEQSRYVYLLYGAICLAGGALLGNRIPETPPVSIRDPLSVIRQPEFIACLPLFFLESGLFGISQALASAGAVKALNSASHFGWVATVAGLAGGVALYFTRKNRGVQNRVHWLGGSCLVVGIAFVLLGASAWIPALYIGYTVLKSAGGPFLAASEQVLNQRTLDIQGSLSDRIFAREFVLWGLRMISLLMFWALATRLSPTHILAVGSTLLALATAMEYVFGKSLFWKNHTSVNAAI
ncbi:hypothetical protein D3870_20810 [Noviherbaspirillum cavernae]|uniref:MFS transporter n=1 Tax=Noviherbaspirillum cavernae TaxID=2320862 RepID=A0A418WVV2_9BURK|nr:hypothetical protein [Noviherbaspirillum cavernae]RJF96826.1 hypothetical protein D3870_20810 [Noviherbaspirillum cavernae]